MNAHLASMDLATKILIVDDDQGIRTLVASFLEKHGFEADMAGNPAEMRTKLQNDKYDLIVLDVMMPGEDGLTALRKLQQDGGPPVIMLSAVGTDIDSPTALAMASTAAGRDSDLRLRPISLIFAISASSVRRASPTRRRAS